jgi:predicted FMN-binding regulatory protein PaiB
VARFEVTVEFRPAETRPALERLVARMERAHPQPWQLSSLGSRYEQLSPNIIAFRAHVQGVRATFKLGQDERRSTLGEILEHLADPQLVQWMCEFNT